MYLIATHHPCIQIVSHWQETQFRYSFIQEHTSVMPCFRDHSVNSRFYCHENPRHDTEKICGQNSTGVSQSVNLASIQLTCAYAICKTQLLTPFHCAFPSVSKRFHGNLYVIRTPDAWSSQMPSIMTIGTVAVKTLIISSILTPLMIVLGICEGQSWWVRMTCSQCF